MSSPQSLLEGIIQEVRDGFVEAKADGKLEAAEVVHIASLASQKIYKLSGMSVADKKALVLLALKKGLDAAGGLQGLGDLAGLGPEAIATAERQVLNAALASVDGLLSLVPHLFAPMKSALAACLPFCSSAESVLTALAPKDAALIHEAFLCVANVVGKPLAQEDSVKKVVDPEAAAAPAAAAPAAAAPVSPADVTSTLESVTVEPPSLNPLPSIQAEGTPEPTLLGTVPNQ